MKGLFKKDLMVMFQTWWVLILVAGIVLGGLAYFDAMQGAICFFTIFLSMQGVSTIMTDRFCGWNLFQTTFAITRQNAIREKYILAFGLGLIGILLGILTVVLCRVNLDHDAFIVNACLVCIFLFSVPAVAIPANLAFPKSQIFVAMLISFIIPAAMIMIWSQNITAAPVMGKLADGSFGPVSMAVDMQLPLLGTMAAACVILWVISFLFIPSWLAKRDQK